MYASIRQSKAKAGMAEELTRRVKGIVGRINNIIGPETFDITDDRNGPFLAKVCTITGPAIAVAGPASSGARFCSIHTSARLFDSSAPA